MKSLKRSWVLIKIVSDFILCPDSIALVTQTETAMQNFLDNHIQNWWNLISIILVCGVCTTLCQNSTYIHTVSQKNNKKINKGYCDCCSLQCCYIFYCAACAFLQCPLWESANHKIPLRPRLLFGGTFFFVNYNRKIGQTFVLCSSCF